MTILIIFAVIAAGLLCYALFGREWLKSKPWAQGFFAWIEPVEIALFKKSETILFARLKIATGFVLTILTQIGAINLAPFMPFVPDKYQMWVNIAVNAVPLLLSLVGMIDEWLRNRTTKPIELVAVPEVAAPPEVKAAIAQADAAKQEAVAVVQEAKAA
jgi:hypothetical protein